MKVGPTTVAVPVGFQPPVGEPLGKAVARLKTVAMMAAVILQGDMVWRLSYRKRLYREEASEARASDYEAAVIYFEAEWVLLVGKTSVMLFICYAWSRQA